MANIQYVICGLCKILQCMLEMAWAARKKVKISDTVQDSWLRIKSLDLTMPRKLAAATDHGGFWCVCISWEATCLTFHSNPSLVRKYKDISLFSGIQNTGNTANLFKLKGFLLLPKYKKMICRGIPQTQRHHGADEGLPHTLRTTGLPQCHYTLGVGWTEPQLMPTWKDAQNSISLGYELFVDIITQGEVILG